MCQRREETSRSSKASTLPPANHRLASALPAPALCPPPCPTRPVASPFLGGRRASWLDTHLEMGSFGRGSLAPLLKRDQPSGRTKQI